MTGCSTNGTKGGGTDAGYLVCDVDSLCGNPCDRNYDVEPSDCENGEREVRKMYEFKAESFEDAIETMFNWIESGVLPRQNYTVPKRNPERDGYWFILTANWFRVVEK